MSDPVADFMAITGCEIEDIAIDYLSQCDFDVAAAANIYSADRTGGGIEGGRGTGGTVVDAEPDFLPLPASSNSPASQGSPFSPIQVDRLGGDSFPTAPAYSNASVPNIFETNATNARLAELFATPGFVIRGEQPLTTVCSRAVSEDKWVLLAILDTSFRSVCFPRDVWRNEGMTSLSGSIICFEINITTEYGLQLATEFRVSGGPFPAAYIVDPITCHKEERLTVVETPSSALDGNRIVEEILNFICSSGTPSQTQEHREASTTVADGAAPEVIDLDADTASESGKSTSTLEAVATKSKLEAGPPEVATLVTPVELDDWLLPTEEAGGFKLRCRLPHSTPTLNLKLNTPVLALCAYLAYRIYAEETAETLGGVPAIQLRGGGFPPKEIAPAGVGTVVSAWAGVRSGDALTVTVAK